MCRPKTKLMIRENVMAGDKCIEMSQNAPLKNLADGVKEADWAIVRRVRVIPARLRNWNHSDVSPLFWNSIA
jgi:hypothetical protein